MSFITSLKLHNFRCYTQAELAELAPNLIVFSGANGAGKTNVLEAVSFLAPGRGLRKAKMIDVQCLNDSQPWAVSARVQVGGSESQIGTGLDAGKAKRVVRINGENASSQAALADYMACLWLTPQMDRIFLDGASERRRFLDRMIYAFDPAHAGRVHRYDNVLRQRSRLLQEGRDDRAWLEALEMQMAETGVAIAASRLEFVERLQSACLDFRTAFFPHALIRLRGSLESLLPSAPAVEVEAMFQHQLLQSRVADTHTGGAASGPHKSDLIVHYADKKMPADQCSTGEQKALLIGLVLAHVSMIRDQKGAPPVLLLDEVAAHLDEQRRGALYDLLEDLGGQVWLTGTDRHLFETLEGRAQFFDVCEGAVRAA